MILRINVIIFSLLSFLFATSSFSQKDKIEVDKDLVSLNGTPIFKIEIFKMQTFNLKDLNDNKLAIFNFMTYTDVNKISSNNPKGEVQYFDVTFFNDDMDSCEIPVYGLKKAIAKLIIDYDLVKDGKLNETAVKQFVKVNGKKFSENKTNSTTIIIQH
jgi:hypothetical protein